MLVWFLDAFNNLLILHPTVHVCDIKPSEAATVRHSATDSQFSCTYLRDSRSTVSLISLVSLTRFKAMPSMSYELVAGPDITCGSWMFFGLSLLEHSMHRDASQCHNSESSFDWCMPCHHYCFLIKLFACRFSILALIYLKRISSMVQISCEVILTLKIIQTGLIFRLSTPCFYEITFGQENLTWHPHTWCFEDTSYNFRISDWLKMAICMLVYLIHIWYFGIYLPLHFHTYLVHIVWQVTSLCIICLIRKPRSAGDADLEDVNDRANCLDGVRASPRGGGSGIAMTIC